MRDRPHPYFGGTGNQPPFPGALRCACPRSNRSMSEHRRKPSQPQGGGRAAARRGQTGSSSGRRAAPRGETESPSDSYDSGGEERPFGSRAEARRASQRSTNGGGRRRTADGAGPGGRGGRGGPGGPTGPGRGRGRGSVPPKKRII